jgi:cytochrome c-type biogenesis protein CcmH/NrfG
VTVGSGQREQREQLEAEREFLLRSLDDLDNELLAGNVDPWTYRVLHDDYTARAAAVIASIDEGMPTRRGAAGDGARVSPVLRLVTVGGIVAFAVLAAVLLAHAIGQRAPGQTITGNAQVGNANGATPTTASTAEALRSAKAAAEAQPKSYVAQINYARILMSTGDYPDAVKSFVDASKLDPRQPEPLAYSGWITALVSRQVTDPPTKQQLVDAALSSVNRAIATDPTYPDAYAFKGIILAQLENKPCPGATAFQLFLVNASSDNPMRSLVLSALADAVKAGSCPDPTVSPTTKP